ncbi:MAG: glycosyltransferase [Kiritimatiellae bacterium]|nr:glycosyltransferase [Kiritimatiellia bacterium]
MIDVLVATFRPRQKDLDEQLDSICMQHGVETKVIVREDAAGDGPAANFSALLSESRSPYVAFSDQDDIWETDKLSALMDKMRELESVCGASVPLMVFSDASLADADGSPLGGGTFISRQGVDVAQGIAFPRLLMQNFIAGNLMLFNAALREKAGSVPREALMHDSWMALVASAFGKIGFVDRPLVRYRQHGANAVGATLSASAKKLSRAREGVRAFRTRLAENIAQARAFADRYGPDAPDAAHALAAFSSGGFFSRKISLFRHGLWKHGLSRNLALLAFA